MPSGKDGIHHDAILSRFVLVPFRGFSAFRPMFGYNKKGKAVSSVLVPFRGFSAFRRYTFIVPTFLYFAS